MMRPKVCQPMAAQFSSESSVAIDKKPCDCAISHEQARAPEYCGQHMIVGAQVCHYRSSHLKEMLQDDLRVIIENMFVFYDS